MTGFDLVVAKASLAPGENRPNEDRVARFSADGTPPSAGVVLCDGLGTKPESAAAAEEVVRYAARVLSKEGVRPGIWGLDRSLAQAPFTPRDGATTLLAVGADTGGLVGHVLIGNGAVIEVEATRLPSGSVRLLWIGIALPQISWEQGKPALRSVLPVGAADLEAAKGYRTVTAGRARMYLACSDGILTEEERPFGYAEDGTVWQPVSVLFAELLERIAANWDALVEEPETEAAATALTDLLEGVLASFAAGPGLDDDSSIGALLVRPELVGEGGGEG